MSKLDEFIQEKSQIIRNDDIHSASYLAELTVNFIKQFLDNKNFYQNRTEMLQGLSKFANAVCKAKPLMGPIFNHTHHILNFIEELPKHERNVNEVCNLVYEEIDKLIEQSKTIKETIKNLGNKLIINHNTIFSLSYSGYVKETLLTAKKMKKRFTVNMATSAPLNEGITLAEELAQGGIKVVLYSDANMTSAITDSTFVLFGCDRITETSFVNKVGSYAACIIAKNFDIPVYILADTSKILLKRKYLIRFENQNPEEIYNNKNIKLNVQNQYFEEIPIEYVSKVITESGIFETEEFIKRYLI